ncbi:unnamed protein product [Arctogadus glacialis]
MCLHNHETLTERITVSDSRQGPQKGPVTGNTGTRLRGLRELWAETRTIALLDQQEEKPLGRPSGLNPVPGQTAPDQVQTAPDHGQTAPDRGQTAADRGQTAPDRGQTAPDRGQTPDEPGHGNTRTRLRGLRELWAETLTIALLDQEEEKPLGRPSGLNPFPGQTAPDRGQTAPDRGQTAPDRGQTAPDRGQTAPDQGQTPDEPAEFAAVFLISDRALRKDLSQVTGNTRTRLRGLRELWAETRTIALLDQEEEKPLGRPSGLNPVPGQTAPDRGQTAQDQDQTAPDQGQTAPDRVQTAPDQGQTAPDQVQTDQKEKPLGRPSGLNPLGDIKTATQQAEGKGLRPWMHVL